MVPEKKLILMVLLFLVMAAIYAFLWFEPTTPDQRPSWTLGPQFEQTW